MNDNIMLYVMVASIVGLFGWAAFEYAKAAYQFWKEQRHGSRGAAAKKPQDDQLGPGKE